MSSSTSQIAVESPNPTLIVVMNVVKEERCKSFTVNVLGND